MYLFIWDYSGIVLFVSALFGLCFGPYFGLYFIYLRYSAIVVGASTCGLLPLLIGAYFVVYIVFYFVGGADFFWVYSYWCHCYIFGVRLKIYTADRCLGSSCVQAQILYFPPISRSFSV